MNLLALTRTFLLTGLMGTLIFFIFLSGRAYGACPAGQAVNQETGECYTPLGGTTQQPYSDVRNGTYYAPVGTGNNPPTGGNNAPTGGNSGVCPDNKICNPIQSQTVDEFLLKIIDVLLTFALPVIVFFIIYAGFLFVTARGNEEQIGRARTALTWAVIGGVIILGAKLIITVIQGTIRTL